MKKQKTCHGGSVKDEPTPRVTMAQIDLLPIEILCQILSCFPLSEQLKLATVSHRWKQAVDDLLSHRHGFSMKDLPGKSRLTGQILGRILQRLSGLRSLHVFGDKFDVDIISSHCPRLVEVNLHSFRVDESSLERLCRSCPELRTVTLPDKGTDACVETVLRGLPGLRSLGVDVTQLTGRWLRRLPASLRRLQLSGRWSVDPGELSSAPVCPALTELDLTGLYKVKSSQLLTFLDVCPQLERLIAKEVKLADVFLQQLPSRVPGIRHLNLTDCYQLTEAALKRLGCLKSLQSLDLYNTALTDGVLDHLHGATQLTELTVGNEPFGGESFTEDALVRLVLACQRLKTLGLPVYSFSVVDFVHSLSGQMSPDRELTLLVIDSVVDEMDELPPGPLRLVPYDWNEDD